MTWLNCGNFTKKKPSSSGKALSTFVAGYVGQVTFATFGTQISKSHSFQDRNPFVDDRFPPTMASIAIGKIPPEARKVQAWLRPSQLRGSGGFGGFGGFGGPSQQWTVSRTPMASDIRQGWLEGLAMQNLLMGYPLDFCRFAG